MADVLTADGTRVALVRWPRHRTFSASADGGEWRLAEMPERLAASFTIQTATNF